MGLIDIYVQKGKPFSFASQISDYMSLFLTQKMDEREFAPLL